MFKICFFGVFQLILKNDICLTKIAFFKFFQKISIFSPEKRHRKAKIIFKMQAYISSINKTLFNGQRKWFSHFYLIMAENYPNPEKNHQLFKRISIKKTPPEERPRNGDPGSKQNNWLFKRILIKKTPPEDRSGNGDPGSEQK